MTNREYLARILEDPYFIENNNEVEKAMVSRHIACPYYEDEDEIFCKDTIDPSEEMCLNCKYAWLNKNVSK